MADLLIRDISPEIKRALQDRAKQNGSSQQTEARAALQRGLGINEKPWWLRLREAAVEAGGFELELPSRQPAREIDTSDWGPR